MANHTSWRLAVFLRLHHGQFDTHLIIIIIITIIIISYIYICRIWYTYTAIYAYVCTYISFGTQTVLKISRQHCGDLSIWSWSASNPIFVGANISPKESTKRVCLKIEWILIVFKLLRRRVFKILETNSTLTVKTDGFPATFPLNQTIHIDVYR